MRDGEKVTVRALCAMPGVADGAVLHDVEWGPRLATLVGAGRYEVVNGGHAEPVAPAVDVDEADTAAAGNVDEANAVAAGDVNERRPPTRRPRRR